MTALPPTDTTRGPVAWMARHPVSANLLMAILMIGGLLTVTRIKQEIFPEFEIDAVSIVVPYPGASPEEVERGILLALEEAVRGVDGVDKVTAIAEEGLASVTVELMLGTDNNKAAQDIKNEADRITSFPEDAERPMVKLEVMKPQVVSVAVHGEQDQRLLRELAERVRSELLRHPRITQVELKNVPPLEIAIEVPPEALRRYGLTLEAVAAAVGATAVEVPGGGVKTGKGEVLLRLNERRNIGREFADIPLVSLPDGTTVVLGDVAEIRDGFEETDQRSYYNGEPAVNIEVGRVGDQTPIEVAEAVKEIVARIRPALPPGVDVTVWNDLSEIFRDRIDLLLRNGALGLVLVMVLLGCFLQVRLAWWVMMGIPVSFLGGMLFLPGFDVSINMISLFAFIMALGIVVDDAIVVGENVFEMRQQGLGYLDAGIAGARQVAMPVTFSILTNVAAFSPLLFIPGTMGKVFRVMPVVIIAVFVISLFEALFVLPAHLGHQRPPQPGGFWMRLNCVERFFGGLLGRFVEHVYAPVLERAVRWRYFTLALALAILVVAVAYFRSGRIRQTFRPEVEMDLVVASLELPFGAPVERTEAFTRRLARAAREAAGEIEDERIVESVYAQIGGILMRHGPRAGGSGGSAGHQANVFVFLVSADKRDASAKAFSDAWRERFGKPPGVRSIGFRNDLGGPGGGAPVDVMLTHRDLGELEAAAAELARQLEEHEGVKDIDPGFAPGKPQLDFAVRSAARSLGVTAEDLGRQVRAAFHGVEALRQQRGREEVRVMVRYPEAARRSMYALEEMIIRTPGGGEMPLRQAAAIRPGSAYSSIVRENGQRVLHVTADIVPRKNAELVLTALTGREPSPIERAADALTRLTGGTVPARPTPYLQTLKQRHVGLDYGFGGHREEIRKSLASLAITFPVALLVIYLLLAVPFDSYLQPAIIMVSIPFGIVGAVIGLAWMGYQLSIIAMLGIVALSGVVVNDSLVLVDYANRLQRAGGQPPLSAIVAAGKRRLRPILLTSLTTFGGLTPMILETSMQARFMVPMAVSLGYGILFATLIALLLVPALYLIVEDLRGRPVTASHRGDDIHPDHAPEATDDLHDIPPVP